MEKCLGGVNLAKKIRFPLEMADGTAARDVAELKEHFSLSEVVQYYENGKLLNWLRDRYEDDLAASVEKIDCNAENLGERLCAIFGVEYKKEDEVDLEKAAEHNRKVALLKSFTAEERFLAQADRTAFDQDELFDLLDEGESVIYLCGTKFSIPLGKKGITYIGVNKPTVVISSDEIVDWQEKQITVQDVEFDEKYKKLTEEATQTSLTAEERKPVTEYSYQSETAFYDKLSGSETREAEELFEAVKEAVYNLNAGITPIYSIKLPKQATETKPREEVSENTGTLCYVPEAAFYDKLSGAQTREAEELFKAVSQSVHQLKAYCYE